MSQIVGLLVRASGDGSDRLRFLARRFSFTLLAGMEHCDTSIRGGLERFIETEKFEGNVLFITTSDQHVDSWFIQEELIALHMRRAEPRFFTFIHEISRTIPSEEWPVHLFSASEWLSDDEVRIFDGTMEDLVSLLRVTKSLDLPLWQPESGAVREDSRLPMIFQFVPKPDEEVQ